MRLFDSYRGRRQETELDRYGEEASELLERKLAKIQGLARPRTSSCNLQADYHRMCH